MYSDAIWERGTGLQGLAAAPLHLAMRALALGVYRVLYVLVHLMWMDSQTSEYYADWLASTVGSTEVKISALEKLKFAPLLWPVVQRSVLTQLAQLRGSDRDKTAV